MLNNKVKQIRNMTISLKFIDKVFFYLFFYMLKKYFKFIKTKLLKKQQIKNKKFFKIFKYSTKKTKN